jgi:hypothetical protein
MTYILDHLDKIAIACAVFFAGFSFWRIAADRQAERRQRARGWERSNW